MVYVGARLPHVAQSSWLLVMVGVLGFSWLVMWGLYEPSSLVRRREYRPMDKRKANVLATVFTVGILIMVFSGRFNQLFMPLLFIFWVVSGAFESSLPRYRWQKETQ
jgi:hypothetical protein